MRFMLGVCVFSTVAIAQPPVAGPAPEGGVVVTTAQLIRPAGETVEFPTRPVDLVRRGDAVYLKDNRGISVVRVSDMRLLQQVRFPKEGGSMVGLAAAAGRPMLYATSNDGGLFEIDIVDDGLVRLGRRIAMPQRGEDESAFPCGVALNRAETTAYVCLSRHNTLGVVDLAGGAVTKEIPLTGIAPFAVALSPDGGRAYVTVWGGKKPGDGDPSALSAGSPTRIDARGVASSGGVCVVDLAAGAELAYIETGLSASGLVVSADGTRVYAANANSDTVSVIDPAALRVVEQIQTRPSADLPFGSMPNGLALAPEGLLLAACAGNNAAAVIDVSRSPASVRGWIPTGWYPGGVVSEQDSLWIANIKGIGSRTARERDGAFNSHRHRGTLQRVPWPITDESLKEMTARVIQDSRVPQTIAALERADDARTIAPTPVPARAGEPSVFEHVVYIIKENRTYDQVFGSLAAGNTPKGRGKPELCIYGPEITPNQHALAERFVLLDNFYCNGVLSADGHSWATEGNVTPYLERSFGGFERSYTFGDDPLTYSASGFIWDHVLAAGRTFRNYGEFHTTEVVAPAGGATTWKAFHEDRTSGRNQYTLRHTIEHANMKTYTHPESPGWCMAVPDQLRADVFLADLKKFEETGQMPNLVLIYLPQDHTHGLEEGYPTPRACVADNDLALGRIVDAVSRTKFWPKAVIIAVEDDPQDGWDHVDGHRSTCTVASPYARRGAVVSEFYSQASVIHTIERILGVRAQHQLYAMAPLMTACFIGPDEMPDFSPFTFVPNRVPLDEMNPPKKAAGDLAPFYEITARLDFTRPDAADEDEFNRVHWHAAKGAQTPYPESLAGAHGKGLAELGLKLAPSGVKPRHDDDD